MPAKNLSRSMSIFGRPSMNRSSFFLPKSRYVWPSFFQKKASYAEHISIPANIPRDGFLAAGTDIRNFDCLLRVIKERASMAGIHKPMLYIGVKGAAFPLHLEDCGLASVSKHLAGHPKV